MKRIISLILAVTLIFCMIPSGFMFVNAASSKWNGGTSNFIGYTGQGTEESPYYIYTAEQLAYLAKSVTDSTVYTGVYFKLGNDIILNNAALSDYTDSDMQSYLKVWTPIGANCQYSAFNGIFDGAGHTIKGVYTKTGYSGLFAKLGTSAVVKNLGVIDSYVYDEEISEVVGGIAAVNNGTIKNCYFKNSISYSCESGGIAGYNYGDIINCFNQSQIKGLSTYNRYASYANGGIAAVNEGEIEYCFNTGYITGGYTGNAGGIAGKDNESIENCFNSGDVSGRSGNAGGIAGNKSYGSIYNCYNEGDISGNTYIGGICGFTSGRVYNSYNSGAITGSQYTGGIAGTAYAASYCYNVGTVKGTAYYPGAILGGSSVASSYCYYLTGAGNAYRGDLSRADSTGTMTALTKEQMKLQDSYTGFDFESEWKLSTSYDYPILRSINSSVDEIENENAIWTDISGDCTVSFNGKEFIVSGNGAMGSSSQSKDSPWKDLNQKVIVEEGVTSVGAYYFNNCVNVKEISMADSVKSIGSYAFNGCTGITNVNLPKNLEEISGYAFYGSKALTNVVFGESPLIIGEYAFSKCTALKALNLEDIVATIGDYAFSGCTTLEAVNFGTAVIGNNSFEKTALAEITIPETVEITGSYAFYDCKNLTKATVNTKEIPIYTFSGCTSLSELVLGDSVENIASGAFENCAIKDLHIPASVKLVMGEAFRNCKLENVSAAEGNENRFSLDNCIFEINALGEIELVLGCNNSVISSEVGFTAIRPYAFQNCTSFETVTVPKGVGIIDDYSFLNCSNLTEIYLPDDVSFIGESAFDGCGSIDTVYYSGSEQEWNDIYVGDGNDTLLNAEIIYDYKPVISGDINDDGVLNSVDLTNLKTAMFGDYSYSGNESCDINADGAIDILDLIKLKILLLDV